MSVCVGGWLGNECSCIIDLPWKPKLAAAGGTTHVFDKETGKVVKHIERWDIEVDKVLKQLLVPANKLPTNRLPTPSGDS